jgi:hypothetical protein
MKTNGMPNQALQYIQRNAAKKSTHPEENLSSILLRGHRNRQLEITVHRSAL